MKKFVAKKYQHYGLITRSTSSINNKQHTGIVKQVCKSKQIPLMLPLIKIHKNPQNINVQNEKNFFWVSYDLYCWN